MATPSSGEISIGDMRSEFNGSGATSLGDCRSSEAPFINLGTPSSGQIRLSDLYNKEVGGSGLTANSNSNGWLPILSVSNPNYQPTAFAYVTVYVPDTSTNTIKIGLFSGTSDAPAYTTYIYKTYNDTFGNSLDGATWSVKYWYGSDVNNKGTSIGKLGQLVTNNGGPTPPDDGFDADTAYSLTQTRVFKWRAQYNSINGNTGIARVLQNFDDNGGVTLEFIAVVGSDTYTFYETLQGPFDPISGAKSRIDLSSTYGLNVAGPL
jgi:hypothetical protein